MGSGTSSVQVVNLNGEIILENVALYPSSTIKAFLEEVEEAAHRRCTLIFEGSKLSPEETVANCGLNAVQYPVVTAFIRPVRELIDAGYKAYQLRTIGCTAQEMSFAIAELTDAGYKASQLRRSGFMLAVTASEWKGAGFTIAELKGAGCTAWELKRAGYILAELKEARYAGTELITSAGFTASEWKGAGFTIAELRGAGCTAWELKRAGFAASELKNTGFILVELKDAGYTACELRSAGFILAELKETGFTAWELMAAGFTASELIDVTQTQQAASQMQASQHPAWSWILGIRSWSYPPTRRCFNCPFFLEL